MWDDIVFVTHFLWKVDTKVIYLSFQLQVGGLNEQERRVPVMQRKIVPDIVAKSSVATITSGEIIVKAAKTMAEKNIAAMIIVDIDSNIMGILTERDIVQRVVAKEIDPKTETVGSIMTENPDTLSPDDSASDALELMQARNYRHLPVEEDGKCVAVVSIRDLYAAAKEALEENIRETEAFVFGDQYGR